MADNFKVPATEIERRLAAVQQALQRHDIDGLFIVQRVDLFYFSGTAQNGFLFIPAQGEALLFIKKYFPRASQESSIRHIIAIESIKAIPRLMLDFYGHLPKRLAFEFDVLPVRHFNYYRTLFPKCEGVDGSAMIHAVRMIKSFWEVKQLEKTAALSHRTFAYMQTVLPKCLTEREFAGRYLSYARKIGHGGRLQERYYRCGGELQPGELFEKVGSSRNGDGFGSSAVATAFSTDLSSRPDRKILPHEPMVIDLGFVYNGYHTDEARLFSIGSLPDKTIKTYRSGIEIHQALLASARPGYSVGDLLDHAFRATGVAGDHKVQLTGHGIGLEMIESPVFCRGGAKRLMPGMVFVFESKMALSKTTAVHIKSVFLVTDTGSRLISEIPLDVFIC